MYMYTCGANVCRCVSDVAGNVYWVDDLLLLFLCGFKRHKMDMHVQVGSGMKWKSSCGNAGFFPAWGVSLSLFLSLLR